MNAICPLCGQIAELFEPLPKQTHCPYCDALLSIQRAGKTAHLSAVQTHTEDEDAVAVVEREKDPIKKYAGLLSLEKTYPNSLCVQYALLMHGRLHERNPKRIDFAVIKCYLLHPYEVPNNHTQGERRAFAREIFDHPRLLACLAISSDADAFLKKYLVDLCAAYISLFLKSASRYGMSPWGLMRSGKPEKTLAAPVAAMYLAMGGDADLTEGERDLLKQSLYDGFEKLFSNTSYLDPLLQKT